MKHRPRRICVARRLGTSLLGALVLFASACGGDDGSSSPTGGSGETEGSSDVLTHLPPPVARACGAGEQADDRFCVHECLADADPTTAQLEVVCEVTEIRAADDGATLEVELLPCSADGALPPGADACFDIHMNEARSAECINDDWPAEVEVVRAEGSVPGCRIEPRCKISTNRAVDCPDQPTVFDVCGDGTCALGEGCKDCPRDCGDCAEYPACDQQSDCDAPTRYCASPPVFDEGDGLCTVACDEFHPCPEWSATGARADCRDGFCVMGCDAVGDADCPTGTTCVDLGPIEAGGNVFLCMP